MDSNFKPEAVIVILYAGDNYEFWQGGTISNAEVLWHLEQYRDALIRGTVKR